ARCRTCCGSVTGESGCGPRLRPGADEQRADEVATPGALLVARRVELLEVGGDERLGVGLVRVREPGGPPRDVLGSEVALVLQLVPDVEDLLPGAAALASPRRVSQLLEVGERDRVVGRCRVTLLVL